MALTKESVIEALKTIIGPNGNDIVTGGEVRALTVDGNNVSFVLEIDQSLSIWINSKVVSYHTINAI